MLCSDASQDGTQEPLDRWVAIGLYRAARASPASFLISRLCPSSFACRAGTYSPTRPAMSRSGSPQLRAHPAGLKRPGPSFRGKDLSRVRRSLFGSDDPAAAPGPQLSAGFSPQRPPFSTEGGAGPGSVAASADDDLEDLGVDFLADSVDRGPSAPQPSQYRAFSAVAVEPPSPLFSQLPVPPFGTRPAFMPAGPAPGASGAAGRIHHTFTTAQMSQLRATLLDPSFLQALAAELVKQMLDTLMISTSPPGDGLLDDGVRMPQM